MPFDPRSLWAVELDAADRSVLESAFRRDPELPTDVGYALAGLVELGVEEVFVRAVGALVVVRASPGQSGHPASSTPSSTIPARG